jgi:serine/threonine-protein phosphatase 2B catalytic subunit
MASPRTQTANAIAAIHARNTNQATTLQIPDIDFTQHQLENGEVVSTTERVVKDVSWFFLARHHAMSLLAV